MKPNTTKHLAKKTGSPVPSSGAGSPNGYVAAMSEGQPWHSSNGFLNAILVSVMRRDKKTLDSAISAGVTFEIRTEPTPSRKLLVRFGDEIVGTVIYRASGVPRDIATRVLSVLSVLAGKPLDTIGYKTQTARKNKTADNVKVTDPKSKYATKGPTKSVGQDTQVAHSVNPPIQDITDLDSYVPPVNGTKLVLKEP